MLISPNNTRKCFNFLRINCFYEVSTRTSLKSNTVWGDIVKKKELRVFTFGSCKVVLGGEDKSYLCSHKKAFAILFLALLKNSVPKIAHTLWEYLDPKSALSNFYVNFHNLRKILNLSKDVLFVKNGTINVKLDSVYLDYEEFLKKTILAFASSNGVEKNYLAEAKLIYTGEFLPNFYNEKWTISFREEAKDRYVMILDRLTELFTISGEYEKALNLSQELLSIDAYHENAHYWRCVNYAKMGYLGKAKKYYEEAVELFKNDLGWNLTFSLEDVLKWNPGNSLKKAKIVSAKEFDSLISKLKNPALYIAIKLKENLDNPKSISKLFREKDVIFPDGQELKLLIQGIVQESVKNFVESLHARLKRLGVEISQLKWKYLNPASIKT